jgi:DNA polymerase-1
MAQPGATLIVADYAAIQLRIIADMVQDPELIRCFRGPDQVDPHTRTAAEMLGKPVTAVTAGERKQAKPVNFGFAFGMGAARLVGYARDHYGVELTLAQAIAFRNAFFRVYPSIHAWHRRVSATAAGTTEVRTASGRLRILRTVNGRPPFTEILNTPVQGTEADGVKRAMALLHPRLKEFGASLIAVVHDEFVVETPAEVAEAVKAVVVKAMVGGMAEFVTTVPVVVEAVVSDCWAKS